MKKQLIILLILVFSTNLMAQFPKHVKSIGAQANATVKVKGDLAEGEVLTDLSWAWRSSMACFPGTQQKKFTGKHVFYSTVLPPHAIMNITVVPDDKNANFSLYAYQVGTTNFGLVPGLTSCVTCEADHKWDYPKKGRTQDHTRSVSLNAIKNPYNVVIGVVGANGLKTGGFTLSVQMQGGEPATMKKQEQVKVYSIKAEKGKILSYTGNLNTGVQVHDLSWAWRSSVACFPETQKQKFTGNHVVYVTEIPRYSKMEVLLEPADKSADFSLYVYEIGTTSNAIVPNLSSCVTCEVDHKWDRPKVGQTQDHTRTVGNITAINNPYKVVIGVAGANGLKEGGYTLKVKLEAR